MHLFIHIGTHKTGTTSLQSFLYAHSDEMAKAGFYIPHSGRVAEAKYASAVHHNLAFELMQDSRFDRKRGGLKELVAELRASSADKAIISSEELSYLVDNPKALLRLERTLCDEGHSISWFMVCRRVDDYSESLYGLLVGCGIRPSLEYPGFVINILFNGKYVQSKKYCRTVHYFDFAEFARRWRKQTAFPLHLLDYEQAATGLGVLPCLLQAIGAPPSIIADSVDATRQNLSRKEVLRRYRRLLRPLLMARFHRSNLRVINY